MRHPENKGTYQGSPHIAQSANGHDQEGLDDQVWSIPRVMLTVGRYQSSSQSRQTATDHESERQRPSLR